MTDVVGSVYDRIAPFYNWVFGPSLEGARRKAIQFAKIEKGEKVLEVGVGTGLTFRHLPPDIDFTGVDLSEKMLALAAKKMRELDRHYTLTQMDATKLELPSESFDLVISAHFLSATSNPIPALLEIRRVVKKNGRVLLVNNFQKKESLARYMEPIVKHFGFSLQLNLEQLCARSGFRVHKRSRVSYALPIDAVLLIP